MSTLYDTRIPYPLHKLQSILRQPKITSYLDTPPSNRLSSTLTRIVTLAWSPLGNYVATGSADKKLRVWNPERENVKHSTELRGHSSSIEQVAFNPVREAELASCSLDGTVKIWDVRSKAVIADFKTDKQNFSLAWKPNGEELLVGTKDDTLIRLSRSTNSEISRHQQSQQTNHTAFSHSGSQIFLTAGDGTLKIASYPSLETLHTLHGHTSSAFSVSLSPPATHLAVGGLDAMLTLWDTSTWSCVRAVAGMAGPVRSLGFSWCGGYVVAGGDQDRGVDVVHVESGEVVGRVGEGPVLVVGWSPKDYSLAYAVSGTTASDNGLRIVSEGKTVGA